MKSTYLKIPGKLLLILSFAFSTQAFAKNSDGANHKKPKGAMHLVLEQLDLTDAQQTEIKNSHKDSRDTLKTLQENAKKARETFESTMANENATKEELVQLQNEMIVSKDAIMKARFEKMLKIRFILDAEQRKKFHTLMEEQKPHRGRGHHSNDKKPEQNRED